jgi:long-chain acyl-CoA synthetase
MDQDGFFYLVDRKDDLIISSGFNIYPGEIEEILRQHPKVKDAAAVGVPDRIKGQTVVAVIALKPGVEADKQELLKYCKDNMPEYRLPRAILFKEEIPRDPAGKILRRMVKQEALDL